MFAYKRFVERVENMDDTEWASKIAIVDWAGDRTSEYFEAVKRCKIDSMKEAGKFLHLLYCIAALFYNLIIILNYFFF